MIAMTIMRYLSSYIIVVETDRNFIQTMKALISSLFLHRYLERWKVKIKTVKIKSIL